MSLILGWLFGLVKKIFTSNSIAGLVFLVASLVILALYLYVSNYIDNQMQIAEINQQIKIHNLENQHEVDMFELEYKDINLSENYKGYKNDEINTSIGTHNYSL